MATQDPSIDAFFARNNTKVFVVVDGKRVGRVQSIREDISNNVQVLAQLGSAFNVELKKGITTYTFSIARFYCRRDFFDDIKLGRIFSLAIRDDATKPEETGGGAAEMLEYFRQCSVQSISRDYTVGQASVGENATVVTIGKGLDKPTTNV